MLPNGMDRARGKKLLIRFAALAIIGLVFARIAPTLANEGTTPPQESVASPTALPSETSSPSASPSSTNSESPTPTSPTLSPIPSSPSQTPIAPLPSGSPTPSPTPSVLPASQQVFHINFPTSLPVDPRAHTIYLPAISVSGPTYAMACLTSGSAVIDVYQRNIVDSIFFAAPLVQNDLSTSVIVTGTTQQVAAIINGGGGAAFFDTAHAISGQRIVAQFVALSAPTLNPSFCAAATQANTRIVRMNPLGITIDTKKGDIALKR